MRGMPDLPHDLMVRALEAFGVALTGLAAPGDARSGAGIHPVVLPSGSRAYLKVTAADGVAVGDTLTAAERELRFYREVGPRAPVRTPPLLDALVVDEGVALLLGDAGEQRDVVAWSVGQWRTLGRELARLHTMSLPTGDWQRPDDLLAALEASDLSTVVAFWFAHLPQLDELLAVRAELGDLLRSLPPVFVHGDCHTANVVHRADRPATEGHGPDDLALCDWQSAGTGRATSDLALLSVRATPSGVRVPAAFLEEYLSQCAREGTPQDAAEVSRNLLLEELAVLVFQWPPFAAYNGPAGISRVRRRARYLAERLKG